MFKKDKENNELAKYDTDPPFMVYLLWILLLPIAWFFELYDRIRYRR